MTLTAAQAEIVRRFVAGEAPPRIAQGLSSAEGDGMPWVVYVERVESALRAALIEKDAEIERLKEKLAILDIQTRHSS